MLAYWQNNVAENFLPPISAQKRVEVETRKQGNEPLKVKKQNVIRTNSARRGKRSDNFSDDGLGHYINSDNCMLTAVPNFEQVNWQQ